MLAPAGASKTSVRPAAGLYRCAVAPDRCLEAAVSDQGKAAVGRGRFVTCMDFRIFQTNQNLAHLQNRVQYQLYTNTNPCCNLEAALQCIILHLCAQ